MAETSRSRVTITLGRSGQVVKRAGVASDGGHSNSLPSSGSKRSVRDRLGSNADLFNKRQRGDGVKAGPNINGLNDRRIGKGDLRLKLLQKSMSRRTQNNDQQESLDLRQKLTRNPRPPTTNLDTQPRLPESKDTAFLGKVPSRRNVDDLSQMDSLRNSYSAWSLDQLRRTSPVRTLATSRDLSQQRTEKEVQNPQVTRMADGVRSIQYTSKDVHDSSRHVGPSHYVTKSSIDSGSVKPVAPTLAHPHPPTGILQKTPFMGGEPLTVDSLLHSLGLDKYAILFKAEEVDMTALKQMGENDLKELGVPMGPRKKIIQALQAIMPRSKRQIG